MQLENIGTGWIEKKKCQIKSKEKNEEGIKIIQEASDKSWNEGSAIIM